MPKRAALYIRVSSDEQARHGLSLGEQRADLLSYAKEHGYIVMGIYADEGVTARKALSRRKELQRLLADVEQGLVDIIIIKCLDRWFRNIADFYKVKEKLDAHGVDWECTREQYNTTTPNGILMLNLKLSIAQNESDQTSERIKYVFEGKKQRKEIITGNLPLGIKAENGHAVPDENAPVVEFIYNHYLGGGSMRSAMTAVYEKYGLVLNYYKVKNVLTNRTYIGELYGIPDYLPAIIPHDIFFRVQDLISRNNKPAISGRIYLFSGLIRCPECGHTLGGRKGRVNQKTGEYWSFEYVCSHRVPKGAVGCHFTRTVFETKLEKYMLDNLQQMVREHIVTVENRRIQQEKDRPENKIESLKAKLSRLEDIYLEGAMNKEKYLAAYKDISRQISELSLLIDRSFIIPSALQEIADDANFRETYESLTRKSKQRFWKSIVKSITFDPTPETFGKGAYIPFQVIFL